MVMKKSCKGIPGRYGNLPVYFANHYEGQNQWPKMLSMTADHLFERKIITNMINTVISTHKMVTL